MFYTNHTSHFYVYCTLFFDVCCVILKEEITLIKYKIDVLQSLKQSGYSTYKIRKEKVFTEAQLQQMRTDRLLTQEALNKLCTILQCQPGDILEYIPDDSA